MSRSLNKVMLIGNVADEPSSKPISGSLKVVNITVATNDTRRQGDDGNYSEQTEWHRVVLWNRLGDIAEQYVHKGSKVYIEGKIRTRSYQDRDNIKRYATEIIADQLIMLDRPGVGQGGYGNGGYNNGGYQARNNNGWGQQNQPAPAQSWQNQNNFAGQAPQQQGGFGGRSQPQYNNNFGGQQAQPSANPFQPQEANSPFQPQDANQGFNSFANPEASQGFNNFAAAAPVADQAAPKADAMKEPSNTELDDDLPF